MQSLCPYLLPLSYAVVTGMVAYHAGCMYIFYLLQEVYFHTVELRHNDDNP
jgi:hypothetical protein